MPTSASKNLLYRIALPLFSPALSKNPIIFSEGHELTHKNQLISVLRRNRISGGAFHLESLDLSTEIFTRAFHTDRVPGVQTYFRVASVTKMATALLSVVLADRGILDIDAPVASMLPDGNSVPELKGILFHHLLSHTSGLMDPPGLENSLINQKTYIETIHGFRSHSPGESFQYSNLGFGLAGCIFEFLLGLPLSRIFMDYLFVPLGMNATLEACSLPETCIMPVIRILPYKKENYVTITKLGRMPLDRPDPLRHYGYSAGSMYTDLPSLVKLVRCIRDGGRPLISSAYSGFMMEKKAEYGSLSPSLSYGSGLLIVNDPRISPSRVLGHQGFAYGCADGAFWEEDTGNIFVSLNGGCSEARSGRFGVANLELGRWAFGKELPSWK